MVLCLLIAPAIGIHSWKGCSCSLQGCLENMNMSDSCCGKSLDCVYQTCTCSSPISQYFGTDYCDPACYGQSKNLSRPSSSADSKHSSKSGNAAIACSKHPTSKERAIVSSIASKETGPPDMDIVQFLPSSARSVFLVLASGGPLTQKEIIRRTDLPARTVRYALDRLKGEDMLEERFCFQDARQSLYNLTGMATRAAKKSN